jgi:cysteine desulfurase/selenocysteine lyase
MLIYKKVRADFPHFNSKKSMVKHWFILDNGATSQKASSCNSAISKYYQEINANIHRGVHTLLIASDA